MALHPNKLTEKLSQLAKTYDCAFIYAMMAEFEQDPNVDQVDFLLRTLETVAISNQMMREELVSRLATESSFRSKLIWALDSTH